MSTEGSMRLHIFRSSTSKGPAAIHRVNEEIHGLTEAQVKAIEMATFVGMTPDERHKYDERQRRITMLRSKLQKLISKN